jgi:S-adenosylmethionine:tRNA ribosyltransferase-isomerase
VTALTLDDFDYALPPELVAQHPAADRGASRLLHVDAAGSLHDRRFAELPALLQAGDLLVLNDTRVIKARLFGSKPTGGKVEVLVERVTGEDSALAQVRASKTPPAGSSLRLADAFEVRVEGRAGEFFVLRFPGPVLDLLDRYGALPLPPYITHAPDAGDDARYQTVFGREPGAVAAPTAGLHFNDALLVQLREGGVQTAFVTLHVGAGTFQPVRVEDITQHRMHSERYTVPAATAQAVEKTHAQGRRVVAVGTTSLRALESAARGGTLRAESGETDLFVTPGFAFRVADALVTNFHLPKSTLLMLVSAFAGMEPIRRAYRHAVDERYRFFSYGDAMFLERAPS